MQNNAGHYTHYGEIHNHFRTWIIAYTGPVHSSQINTGTTASKTLPW